MGTLRAWGNGVSRDGTASRVDAPPFSAGTSGQPGHEKLGRKGPEIEVGSGGLGAVGGYKMAPLREAHRGSAEKRRGDYGEKLFGFGQEKGTGILGDPRWSAGGASPSKDSYGRQSIQKRRLGQPAAQGKSVGPEMTRKKKKGRRPTRFSTLSDKAKTMFIVGQKRCSVITEVYAAWRVSYLFRRQPAFGRACR